MQQHQTEVNPEERTERSATSRNSVFLIDNAASIFDAVSPVFSGRSFQIISYDDPCSLLDALERERPAVVFVGLDIPGVDGIGLIAEIGKRGYNGIVVAVADADDRETIKEAIRAGADYVLFKPPGDIELELIAEKVESKPGLGDSSVEALKVVLQKVEQGVILVDEEYNLAFANRRAHEMLSTRTTEELAGVIERNCSKNIFDQSKKKHNVTTFLDISLPGRDKRDLIGIEIYYLDSALRFPYYLIFMHDFSQWKKLDELHSRFATSLSHRMRTPLTAIRNAVRILSEERETLPQNEREKLLDIGWRNIEKLIANLDELQKIFMIESEELNVCRILIRVKTEIKKMFRELESEGRIKGFKLKMDDFSLPTGHGRLRDFITTAMEAYVKWMGEAPFIESAASIREDVVGAGVVNRRLKISMRPRSFGRMTVTKERIKDFLTYQEAHRGLVLNRLARALDGEVEINPRNTISLLLPMDPPFNHEKDLIHPLHMMMERAELTGGEFHLVDVRMVGMVDGGTRFMKLLERSICRGICTNSMVSKGEEPLSYSFFVINSSFNEVSSIMRGIHDRFVRSCRESGEEIYPSLRWEIRYSRKSRASSPSLNDSCIETVS